MPSVRAELTKGTPLLVRCPSAFVPLAYAPAETAPSFSEHHGGYLLSRPQGMLHLIASHCELFFPPRPDEDLA